MQDKSLETTGANLGIVFTWGEEPIFQAGDHVRVLTRSPVGHSRVPTYMRGKTGAVEAVIVPAADASAASYRHQGGTASGRPASLNGIREPPYAARQTHPLPLKDDKRRKQHEHDHD